MDYEKKYSEALKWMRELYPGLHGATKEDAEHYFPELRESEDFDEKVRKWLVDYFSSIKETVWIHRDITCGQILAWLEKHKYDRMKPIYDARESFESAHEKAWNDYHNGYENVDKLEDDYVECAHAKGFREGYLFGIEKQKVQKPQGVYVDCTEHPEWYGMPPKEQKPAEKQDYSGLNDLERAIHRGFLCAGVENVPVTIIKETARDCLARMKPAEWSDYKDKIDIPYCSSEQEWSEEDEKRMDAVIELLENTSAIHPNYSHRKLIIWLKSLRPSWKPSEEQMKALEVAFRKDGDDEYRNIINSLYNDLKKL